jgi:hypothetical protein
MLRLAQLRRRGGLQLQKPVHQSQASLGFPDVSTQPVDPLVPPRVGADLGPNGFWQGIQHPLVRCEELGMNDPGEDGDQARPALRLPEAESLSKV